MVRAGDGDLWENVAAARAGHDDGYAGSVPAGMDVVVLDSAWVAAFYA